MERSNGRALFIDVVFLEKHVNILSDPIFGNIADASQNALGLRPSTKLHLQEKTRAKGNSFVTTVTSVDSDEEKTMTNNSRNCESLQCHCCSHAHLLEKCQQFKGKNQRDKISFLKKKGICFGCLSTGPISRDCIKHLICEICDQHHPTVLYIKKAKIESHQTNKSPEVTSSTLHQTCGHTGAGRDHCFLSIMPVQVKAANGSDITQTYALLDPDSTATFCSEHLMHKLKVKGRRTHFLLKTMGHKGVIPAYSLLGLEVSGLERNYFYPLLDVFTQKQMPVSANDISTATDVERWPYLSKFHIPNITANVDLLIGTNAPKILEPWEVVNSCGNGPYVIRTVLG